MVWDLLFILWFVVRRAVAIPPKRTSTASRQLEEPV